MKSNLEIIQKADLALADIAPGGLLVPKQAARFLKIAIKKNVMSNMVRSVTMTHPEEEQPKLLWTGQVLHPATGGTALTEAQRAKPTFDKVSLVSKLAKAEVHIHREVLEDQIERNVFKNTLVGFLGEKVGGDIENALINGDVASANDWLALQDGIIKKITTNVVLAGVVDLDEDILSDTVDAMPEEFDDQAGLQFFTNRTARSRYRLTQSGRATANLGDGIIMGNVRPTLGYDGVPLTKVPRFPNNLGGGTNETVVLYLDPRNVILGFQRKVTLETEFRISEQVWAIVVTLRMAIQIEHEPATAKATQVLGQ